MGKLKLTDGMVISFEKCSGKNRFLMNLTTIIDGKKRGVSVHLHKDTMNWISLEIEELLNNEQ